MLWQTLVAHLSYLSLPKETRSLADDDTIHPKFPSGKENVAASAPKLAPNDFLMFYHEQMSTQAVLSAGIQVYRFVHCVPHFERMLYDNAQLALAYLYAWQVTGNKFFRTIAEELRHSRDDGP